MSDAQPKISPLPPASTFTGPVAESIAQRMVQPPNRPGLLAVLDHFEILRVLGGGGMGLVLLARDTVTGQEAAIKLIRYDLVTNQQVVHRFLKEAGHLKRLRHTHIVPVTEISDRAECPYFVMPYFEKGSLASRIKPSQPLAAETVLAIARQLAEGLSFAHRSGIIHRDLKPANILLGASGQVCLADFGLARTVFNDTIVNVETPQWEGTAPYMSPALAAGDAEDTRCDIYSFGALLYEMLTGCPPYQGQSTKEILNQILAGPPPPILSRQPEADRGLVAVAEKAMARELKHRYADMRDVLDDLTLIGQGKKPSALAPGGPKNFFKYAWVPLLIAGLCGAILWAFKPHPPAPIVVVRLAVPTPVSLTSITPPPVAAPPVAPVPATPTPVAPAPVPTLSMISVIGQLGNGGRANGPAGQAQFRLPNNVAVGPAGTVYVADTGNHLIRKITPDGQVTTLAGAGSSGAADGAGNVARFKAPFGIAVDRLGNVFVADTINNTIRKITPDGVVCTVAGLAGHPGSSDGTGASARFRNPWGVAVDHLGNLLVADMGNDTIRKITPTGRVTTLAGLAGTSGQTDGPEAGARFSAPFALALDDADNLYISDSGNQTIRRLTPDGEVITLAGQPGVTGDADGNRGQARFCNPQGLAADHSGNIYVADAGNNRLRKITPTGRVTTLPLPPNSPRLNNPCGVALDAQGNLYVADTSNHCLRRLPLPSVGPP